MVAVISSDLDMQKEGTPPVVIMPEPSEQSSSSSKKHVILTSWASVATALLLMMLVGGAFYVADLKGRECTTTTTTDSSEHSTKDYSRTYDNDGDKTTEDFHVDEDDQTELIIKKNDDGNIELITAIDFKRKISASYVPAADQCLLLSGVDMDWVNDWDSSKNLTVKVAKDQIKEENFKVSGNKVTDLSILPSVMRPYCNGKPTYWMQPSDDSTDLEVGRQKRGICICRTLYIWYSYPYYYYYWYYYYCYC